MKARISISTEDLVISLIHEKINLTKMNDEKDRIIKRLQSKLNKYERNVENAR